MPKQFQRTKGLKTGIGVGDAQLWGKSDAVGVAQKQQQIELQKKKYGLAEKKQKADALKAKAKIMQGLAPTGQGYFLEGFNLTEDGYLDTYKQIYGNTNWDDPRSVADTQTAFNNLKRELNILQESDELVKGKFQKLDLDKSYVGEEELKGLVESKEAVDPVDAQVKISAFREKHDVMKDTMDMAKQIKADLKVKEEGAKTQTDKEADAVKVQNAKDNLWDSFQNNYSVEAEEQWKSREEFDKFFDDFVVGKEDKTTYDEGSKPFEYKGGRASSGGIQFSHNDLAIDYGGGVAADVAGLVKEGKFDVISMAKKDVSENKPLLVRDPSDKTQRRTFEFLPIYYKKEKGTNRWTVAGKKITPVRDYTGKVKVTYQEKEGKKLVDRTTYVTEAEANDNDNYTIEYKETDTEIPFNENKDRILANWGNVTPDELLEGMGKSEYTPSPLAPNEEVKKPMTSKMNPTGKKFEKSTGTSR